MSEPDFNAHICDAPRAGCTAADRGQALWDVMTVLAGRRALGSVHADETRGGMEEILELWPLIKDAVEAAYKDDEDFHTKAIFVAHFDALVGLRRDVMVYSEGETSCILRKHKLFPAGQEYSTHSKPFLMRSLTEIFPLGSPERNAIDEMYGEDSQSQCLK